MKMRWILACLCVLAAGILWQRGRKAEPGEQPLTEKIAASVRQLKNPARVDGTQENPAEETQRLLKEAANRRFKVDKPSGMLTDDPSVAEDLTRQVAVEMLLDTLIREKIDQDPEYVQATEHKMLSKEPRLMTLKQADSTGDMRTAQVLVADTRDCQGRLASAAQFEVRVADLSSGFCMHPTLEYPGGFDSEKPLQLIVAPVQNRTQFPAADRQWERLVKVEMRAAITAEFIPRYKATGALTL